jgi:hypothetical protein
MGLQLLYLHIITRIAWAILLGRGAAVGDFNHMPHVCDQFVDGNR